jgi:subfamily B ATP-binding cassette protein MsbA
LKEIFEVLSRTYQLCKAYWKIISVSLILLALATGLGYAPAVIIGRMVDVIQKHSNVNILVFYIAAIVFIPLFAAAFQAVQLYISTNIGYRVQEVMRRKIEKSILYMDVATLTNQTSSELAVRAQRDTTTVKSLIIDIIFPFFLLLFNVIFSVAVSASLCWELTLLLLVMYPLTIFPSDNIAKKRRELYAKALHEEDQYNGQMVDVFRGNKTVRRFNRQEAEIEALEKRYGSIEKYMQKIDLYSWIDGLMLNKLVQGLSSALTYGGGVLLIVNGLLTIGGLVAFLAVAPGIYSSVTQLTRLNHTIKTQKISFERLDGILSFPQEPQDGHEAMFGDIEFKNVEYSYNNADKQVLKDVSFTVPKGSFCAIVGSSGGGKSTVFELLQKFLHPSGGIITLDGVNIEELSTKSLRAQIAAVEQSSYLFNRTILENISFGKPQATMEKVREAAKLAGIDEFIMSLKNGYQTIISENAQSISGGECQRIAIARALLMNAKILLFDEVTSALDAFNEQKIRALIEKWRGSHTILMITHRLSSAIGADRIFVLHEGVIYENGTHDELVSLNGYYTKMFMNQKKVLI